MKARFRGLARAAYSTLALALAVTAVLPGIVNAYSGGQVTNRSIEMSSSTPSDTNVNYTISFKPITTEATGSVIIDFCSNSPIPGDSCTATSGTNVPNTASVARVSGATGTVSSITGSHTIKIDSTALTSGTAYTIVVNGINNPSATAGTFYARIFTYAAATGAGSADDYVANGSGTPTEGTAVDYGGDALSTATAISITAKVQEELTFCVFTNGAANCESSPSGSSLTLGNANGVLSSTLPSVSNATEYSVQTNASNNAVVTVKGDTLKSGGNPITAIGATAAKSTPGTAQFGICTWDSGGGGAIAPAAAYDGTGGGSGNCSTSSTGQASGSAGTGASQPYYAFNTTNTLSTYGDTLCTVSPGAEDQGTVSFLANIPVSQKAGVYTTSVSFIATGTY